jgi:cell division protein FtsL
MENELREKEELGNPMDAVTGAQTKQEKKRAKKGASNSVKPKRQSLLVQVLNGEILTRDFVLNNLTFIFFILFLLMLMVAKGYYGKQLQTDINELQTELDATTAEYIENKAKLEESTTRYRLVQALEKRGLREMTDPAKVIRVKKKENE